MEIDLALILGAIGTVGTVLSTILVILEIRDRLGAKSENREREVKVLLETIYGPIRDFHDSPGPESATRLIDSTANHKDRILALEPAVRKSSKEIAKGLADFVRVMRELTFGQFSTMGSFAGHEPTQYAIAKDKTIRELTKLLSKDIEKWLSDHA